MNTVSTSPVAKPPKRFPYLLRMFEPAPPSELKITDPAEIKETFRYWEKKVIVATILGYATFYFVRKNLSVAMPVMEESLGISKSGLGLFLTLHGVLYGVSKFVNGFLGDRSHVRTFMVAGLLMSAVMNILFGLSSAVVALGVFWMINGWFQGMGFPPCARAFTHWVPPKELATKMSIWNASTNIGSAGVVVFCGFLITRYHNWQLCFFVPAAIAIGVSIFLWFMLPDTPPSKGLPEVAGSKLADSQGESEDWKAIAVKHVFSNPWIWLLAFANFFVYIVRYAVLDWAPTFLTQAKGIHLANATWMVFAFEMSGMAGALVGGWLTDRLFGGRSFRSCVFYMLGTAISMYLFWRIAGNSAMLNTILLCTSGFFIYGPQCLISIAAANLATKRAAASAVGLTGLFGYLSTVLSGWGMGKLVESYGWDAGFKGMIVVAIIGMVLCAFGWRAKPHGYAS